MTGVQTCAFRSLALEISHRGFVLESGRMALAGPARDLLEADLIREVYLGI